MAIRKNGENITFSTEDCILSPKQALSDKKIALRFIKLAKKLKRVAPRAKDFMYGHCLMMHAAEASLVDQFTGKPILNKTGHPVKGNFEDFINKSGKKSVRWISPDNIKPYKNANGDIFGEAELIKAYKMWVGKPLCKDHKSESVDGIRGIIIDTYYDPTFKRVHALFALDRKNYGDLARKVETGYANCVSMGTAVGRSICTECGNVAAVERDYCKCILARSNYGEINMDLNPIELSLVVNGADGRARIKNIIASMNDYVQQKQERIEQLTADRCVNPTELQALADTINDMQTKLNNLMQIEKIATGEEDLGSLVAALKELKDDPKMAEELKSRIMALLSNDSPPDESVKQDDTEQIEKSWPPMRPGAGGPSFSSMSEEDTAQPAPGSLDPSNRFASQKEGDKQGAFSKELRLLRSKIGKMQGSLNELNKKVSKEENNMNSARLRARAKARRAYWLGGGGVNEPTPGKEKYQKEDADSIRDKEDKQMTGQPLETGSEGLHPGDVEKLRDAGRNGLNLSKADLQDRAMKRRAYWLGGGGVNEPTPGKPKYDKDGMAEQVRNNEDKHLHVQDMGGKDGTVPGDMETKKKLLRAQLRAKFTKVADQSGALRKDASRWDVFAGDQLVLSATGSEIFGDELNDNWDYLSSREYGKDVIRHIRSEGFDRVEYLLKGAQPPMDPMAGGADPLAAAPAGVEEALAPEVEAPAPEAPAEEPKEEGLKGKVDAALGKMEESIEEIRTAVTEGGEKLVDIEVKVDEGATPDSEAAPAPMEGALASLRNETLEVHALMNDSADELALISEALEKGVGGRVLEAAVQALKDSDDIFAKAGLVLAKKEKKEEDDEDEDEKDEEKEDKKEKKEAAEKCKECNMLKQFCKCKGKKDKKEDKDDEKKDKEDKDDEKDEKEKKAQQLLDDALRIRAENRAALLAKAGMCQCGKETCNQCGTVKEDSAAADDVDMADDLSDLAEDCVGDDCADADDFVLESTESVMAARKAARDELVATAADKILGKYELDLGKAENATEKTYFDAHPGGKGTVTELTHTKTDEAKVETISEVHDVMRDVAESGPRNVREAAMMLQEEIIKGAFKAKDLDQLVAEGKVDSAAAAYWKKFWSQGTDTGSFGADLSKEFTSKKKEASDKNYKVKLRRAYDLGLQAQDKGMIGPTRNSLDTYVDEVMQFDDAAFESTKRIMAGVSGKPSGSLPRVVADAATEAMNVTASVEQAPSPNLTNQLSGLGWK